MGKIVLEAQIPDLSKPILFRLRSCNQFLLGHSVKNVVGEPTDHPKDCELLKVEGGLTREYPREKVDDWVRSEGMEFHEILESLLHMVSYSVSFILAQDERRKTREENGRSIDTLGS